MNREPLRAVTEDEKRTYHTVGAVKLSGFFDEDWVRLLRGASERAMAADGKIGQMGRDAARGFTSISYLFRDDPDFLTYATESPAAKIIAEILGCNELRFFHDNIFAKDPWSPNSHTRWHHDWSAWPIDGEQVPSFWMALTSIDHGAAGLHVIAGSHRWGKIWPPQSRAKELPPGAEWCPNFDERRDDPALEFIVWNELEAGDVLMIHPKTAHFAPGNHSPSLRIGLTTRWFGDDITWNRRDYSAPIPGLKELPFGEKPNGFFFPLVYKRGESLTVRR